MSGIVFRIALQDLPRVHVWGLRSRQPARQAAAVKPLVRPLVIFVFIGKGKGNWIESALVYNPDVWKRRLLIWRVH